MSQAGRCNKASFHKASSTQKSLFSRGSFCLLLASVGSKLCRTSWSRSLYASRVAMSSCGSAAASGFHVAAATTAAPAAAAEPDCATDAA